MPASVFAGQFSALAGWFLRALLRTEAWPLVGALLLTANLFLPPPAAAAPIIIPPVTGAGYAELSALWWQYALSFPVATSPFFDTTGANCGAGQSRPQRVFFLVGSLNSDPVQRDQCVAPAGKALFFPMINRVDVNVDHQTPRELRQEIKPILDAAHDLFATIDEVQVANPRAFRSQSAVFRLNLPDDNLFGLPAGTYRPAVADGYYVLVAPLAPGRHTITFGGVDGTGLSQHITYHLTVQ